MIVKLDGKDFTKFQSLKLTKDLLAMPNTLELSLFVSSAPLTLKKYTPIELHWLGEGDHYFTGHVTDSTADEHDNGATYSITAKSKSLILTKNEVIYNKKNKTFNTAFKDLVAQADLPHLISGQYNSNIDEISVSQEPAINWLTQYAQAHNAIIFESSKGEIVLMKELNGRTYKLNNSNIVGGISIHNDWSNEYSKYVISHNKTAPITVVNELGTKINMTKYLAGAVTGSDPHTFAEKQKQLRENNYIQFNLGQHFIEKEKIDIGDNVDLDYKGFLGEVSDRFIVSRLDIDISDQRRTVSVQIKKREALF